MSLITILIVISSLFCASIVEMTDEHIRQQHHFEHDPRIPIRTIKCFECYETNATKGSACLRTKYCEGQWCVKGPDSGGIYRGCMQMLPFNTKTNRCYNVTGENGKINENCYCNSNDFCNSAMQLNFTFTLSIIVAVFVKFMTFAIV